MLRAALSRWLLPRLAGPGGMVVDAIDLFDWQRGERGLGPIKLATPVPDAFACRLHPDDPELEDLRRRYASFDARATTPLLWRPGTVSSADMRSFRGENAYVWQRLGPLRSVNAYALAAYHLLSLGCPGIGQPEGTGPASLRGRDRFARLDEDGAFGAVVYEIAGRRVSRDLLDSIAELDFIERYLGLGSGGVSRILDIGAGYGRLAHRALAAFPEIEHYICADAVAESTYLCELYLRYRGLGEKALVAPLDRIHAALADRSVDLAVNIHSFSECRPEAVDWWLSLLASHGVRNLMIAPNAMDHGGRELLTNDRRPFGPLIERHGYRPVARVPKYRDPVVQRYGLSPTMYHLFELAA